MDFSFWYVVTFFLYLVPASLPWVFGVICGSSCVFLHPVTVLPPPIHSSPAWLSTADASSAIRILCHLWHLFSLPGSKVRFLPNLFPFPPGPSSKLWGAVHAGWTLLQPVLQTPSSSIWHWIPASRLPAQLLSWVSPGFGGLQPPDFHTVFHPHWISSFEQELEAKSHCYFEGILSSLLSPTNISEKLVFLPDPLIFLLPSLLVFDVFSIDASFKIPHDLL